MHARRSAGGSSAYIIQYYYYYIAGTPRRLGLQHSIRLRFSNTKGSYNTIIIVIPTCVWRACRYNIVCQRRHLDESRFIEIIHHV